MALKNFLQNPDLGKLLLRMGVGFVLFLHGFWKITGGMASTVELTANNGWPGWIAYGSILGEFIGPLLVIGGKYSRIGGLLIAFNMLMTVVVAHRDIAFQLNDYGAWQIELNALLLLCGLAVAFTGAGKYSLSKGQGTWD
jgi:putative oxidoreductase